MNESKYYMAERPDILQLIPQGAKTILDVGCGFGNFGKKAKELFNAEVWGIEIVREAAYEAVPKLDKVLIGSVEENLASLPIGYFDVITFNDVLDHLIDPESVLKEIRKALKPSGVIISSIPNIRYSAFLIQLVIRKDWKYEDKGTLDRTHLRFFTLKSINRMFSDCGFEIIYTRGINENNSLKWKLLNMVLLGSFEDTKYYQFLTVSKLKDPLLEQST